jgi:O-antigen/teichoic acid export membrane protein
VNRACRFVLLLILARQLGVEGFGPWVLAVATGTILANTADAGLTTAVTVGLASSRTAARKYVANVWGAAPLLAAAASAVLLLLAPVVTSGTATYLLITVGIAGIAESCAVLLLAPLRAFDEFRPEGIIRALHGTAVLLIGGTLAIASGGSAAVVAPVLVAVALGSVACAGAASIRTFGFVRPALDLHLLRTLATVALPVFGTTAVFFLYFRIDTYLLSFISGNDATGLYGAAFSVAFGLSFLPLLFARSLLARFASPSPAALRSSYRRAASVTAAFAIGLSAVLLLATPALPVLYGDAFAAARPAYALLVIAQGVYFFTHLNAMLFFARGRSGTMWLFAILALAVNVGANLLLIPPFGPTGAALAMVISEAILLAAQLPLVRSALAGNQGALPEAARAPLDHVEQKAA